jgi:transposase
MGRKAKYSKEIKLEIIKRYLKGESGSALANEYNIMVKKPASTIKLWSNRYEELGEQGFDSSNRNKSYSKEFKKEIIGEYLKGKASYSEIANKYNISSREIVRKWVLKYNQGIEIKDYDPKGDVYTMKSRKTTLEEKLEIINYVLSHDNDYKGAADKYSVPYANVYQWIQKYNIGGEAVLCDKRGRPSTSKQKHELTNEEKQGIQIEKLKRELDHQKMINEVLKKNIEIQEQMERNSRKSYKKTNTKR